MKISHGRFLASTAALCISAVAQAQTFERQTTDRTVDADAGTDIVVTAQKRSERLQNVPLGVSAFSEKAIEDQGIRSIQDYASWSAGVRFAQEGT